MSGQSSRSGRNLTIGTVGTIAIAIIAAMLGINLDGDNSESPAASSNAQAPASSSKTQASEDLCPTNTLPKEALDTIDDILNGGPFDYPDNDDKRFGNYEGVLPKQARNYYREYTVETPGLSHRGERRIITGGTQSTDPEVWYYTEDHYDSFCEIPDAE